MEIVGGKVWHMYLSPHPKASEKQAWDKRATRRAASGYVVTPDVQGHPVESVCPYCRVEVIVIKKPGS